MQSRRVQTALLTGALGSASLPNEGIVERAVANAAHEVTACDIEKGPCQWPLVIADGRALPFADKSYDIAVANAVIEHVGDEADQLKFVGEHARVAAHWVITTPNRWFPIESHTATAFKHWRSAWRSERSEFTRLLSLGEFRQLLPASARIVGRPWSATFTAYSD